VPLEINAISTMIVAITMIAILIAWRLGGPRGRQKVV
jgi:ABC-type spermidine/putrescine transport system permease subunit II